VQKRLPLVLLLSLLPAACAAGEVEVLFDGKGVEQWDTARDQARLRREFATSEVKQSSEPDALLWRFVSKGVTFNDLFLRKPVKRRFDVVRVRVRNEGAALTFAAKVRDASGAEWSANLVRLKPSREWQQVEFPWKAWRPASWSSDRDGKLDFPLSYFTLIAFGIKPGVEYRLAVARVEFERPAPPVATLHQWRLPSVLHAGESHQAGFAFSLDKPCRDSGAWLSFCREGVERLRVPIALPSPLTGARPGQRVSVSDAEVAVPLFAAGGRHAVVLQLGEARVEREGQRLDEGVCAVDIVPRKPGSVTSSVKPHRGVPTLFINGRPHNGMAYAAYGPSVKVFRDFTEAGVDLYSFSATPTEAGYGLSRTAWTAPDAYDFSQLDERAMMVLEANPQAYIFPRLYLHAPKWWSEQHPDDLVRYDPGDGKPVPFIHSGGKLTPSWASEAWRRDTIAGLRHLIAHVEASPYADRVVGYHLASGSTEEWMMWGANERQWVGYSPANVARFRQWLTARYRTDAALRKAWGNEAVTLATATIPLKAQRAAAQLGSLRRPEHEQAVIDFYLYHSDLVADTIAVLAKAVKDATKRRLIVGVFYGYVLQLCGEQRQQNAGHLALGKVLACPDVDFLCSPTSYAFRQVGGAGTSHFMSLLGSVQLHGKLWFNENDIRTSLAPGKVGGWGKPADIAGDLLQQDKELANALVNGAAQWWFDVGRNRYDAPALMRRIGELTRTASAARPLDHSPADEMALVVDERSLCHLRVGDRLGRELLLGQLPELHRAGAPVGHYLASDLARLRRHKLLIFPTSLAPSAADRKALDALKGDGRVLVFLYAPGLYRDGKLDESAMTDLTGIQLKLATEPTRLRVTLRPGHALTKGIEGTHYGPDRPVSPVCVADDPQAIVLGTLPDGRPGLVVKKHAGWTAVHSAAPLLPAALIRRIAESAGVHLYIDTPDVVWACRDLLAVSAHQPGTRTIRLPRKATVHDLYKAGTLAAGAESFKADFLAKQTRVFALDAGE